MSNKENDRPQPHKLANAREHAKQRDSHDLSLSPRDVTRDSLVANMLLSLDQLSLGQVNNSSGPRSRTPSENPAVLLHPSMDRSRTMPINLPSGHSAHGHGYRCSSDIEGIVDASRLSSQLLRGRRSNSSPGFEPHLGRINSMREAPHQQSIPGTPSMFHSRGGKTSCSSNSIDARHAQALSSQRWTQNTSGRLPSLDYGLARAPIRSCENCGTGFSKSRFTRDHEDYEAAPTPTVPAGPRKLATVPSMPVMALSESRIETKSSDRILSMRSPRRATVGGRQPESRRKASRDISDLPPVPGPLGLDAAPAPQISYEKPKELAHGAPQPTSQPTKERPGFFKRMFGSTKHALSTEPPQSSALPYVSSISIDIWSSKIAPAADQPTVTCEPIQSATHSLQKKTSSFFRRRKQSLNEVERPPMPLHTPLVSPVPLPPLTKAEKLWSRVETATQNASQSSPMGSLRQAMDPFLHSSPPTPGLLSPPGGVAAAGLLGTADMSMVAKPTRFGATAPVDNQAALSSPRSCRVEPMRERITRHVSADHELDASAEMRPGEDEPRAMSTTPAPTDSRCRLDTSSRAVLGSTLPAQDSYLADKSESDDGTQRGAKSRAVSSEKPARLAPDMDKRSRSSFPNVAQAKSSPKLCSRRDKLEPARLPLLSTKPITRRERRDPEGLGLSMAGISSDGIHMASAVMDGLPKVKVDSIASPKPSPKPSPKVLHSLGSAQLLDPKSIDEPLVSVAGHPTEDDRQKAQKMYDGNEDFIVKEKAAAWMGEEGPVRQRTLRAYMDLHDFTNTSIVASLRQICGRLILKAETQQIDRILVAFANRWCTCNPNHGFKAVDAIHTICYSIMLLNTDLHLAEMDYKMTRGQFVKNTMTTIRQALEDVTPKAFGRQSILPCKGGLDRLSMEEAKRTSFRTSILPPRADSALGGVADQMSADDCGPLVKSPFDGSLRAWESQLESVLKDIYASIRDERLPLFGAEPAAGLVSGGPGHFIMGNLLKRNPSVLSKAPSESMSSLRGRVSEGRGMATGRWSSKSRSRHRGFGTGFSSSRTSLEESNSVWSPTESSATWSRYSLVRTHTSISMDSLGSSLPLGDYQQSIGFANALSQAIIRHDLPGAPSIIIDEMKGEALLDDESLELSGAPWVKEGIVTHKHHLDGVEKKAKDRNWTQVFSVVQKGQLSLFSFSNKSLRNKSRSRQRGNELVFKGAVVGGGNWQENATNLGTFSLRQALASTLPPPGYSRSRPHVWALSLSTGAVHLFQVGTAEICREFVSTANYWSARLSTHPLVGGISNIEYGWGEAIINNTLVAAIDDSTSILGTRGGSNTSHSRTGSAAGVTLVSHGRLGSVHSRGSRSVDHGRPGTSASASTLESANAALPLRARNKLPGESIHIAEWAPPAQSLRASNLPEKDQLTTLLAYVRTIESDLQQHNALRSRMLLAFSPRGHNAQRAMANWQRKSEYLLREIVKFRTYVDSLQGAEQRRKEVYREREGVQREARGLDVDAGDVGRDNVVVGGDAGDVDTFLVDKHKAEVGGESEGDVTIRP